MNEIEETSVYCPYCGESFVTTVELLDEDQLYTEDCFVCCRPIVFNIMVALNGDWSVTTHRESDTF